MQPRVPLTPQHARLSGCPNSVWFSLPAMTPQLAGPSVKRLQQARFSSGRFLPVSLGEGSQPGLSVQEEASNEEPNPVCGERWRGLLFPLLLSTWLLTS